MIDQVDQSVERTTHSSCDQGAEVVAYTMEDGGHAWPVTTVGQGAGATTSQINAPKLMWEFFAAHSKEG